METWNISIIYIIYLEHKHIGLTIPVDECIMIMRAL
jgi:hypothetical protein